MRAGEGWGFMALLDDMDYYLADNLDGLAAQILEHIGVGTHCDEVLSSSVRRYKESDRVASCKCTGQRRKRRRDVLP